MLSALDNQDFSWYSRLSDEDKKAWSSWLTLRYASGVKGNGQEDALINTNLFANAHYNDIFRHDELVWKLLCLSGNGKKQYHEWIKPPHSKKSSDKVAEFVGTIYPHFKRSDIEMLITMNTIDEIKKLASSCGMSDKEIADIFGKKK